MRSWSWARKCRCRGMCMLVFVAEEASVVVGESEANKGKTTCRSSSPEFCRVMSAKGFSNVTFGYRQSRHWCRDARVCPSRSVVIGARLLAAALARSFGWLDSNSPWPGRFLRRLESLLVFDGWTSTTRHWRRGAHVFSSRSVVVCASACSATDFAGCLLLCCAVVVFVRAAWWRAG